MRVQFLGSFRRARRLRGGIVTAREVAGWLLLSIVLILLVDLYLLILVVR